MISISSFNGHERRKYVRVHEPVKVRFRLIGKSSAARAERRVFFGKWIEGRSSDVGRGGLCLEFISPPKALVTEMLKKENMIEVEVHLPIRRLLFVGENIKYFRALGKIAWKKQSGKNKAWRVGINFTKIGAEAEKLISNYIVERYIKKYGGDF